MTGSTERRPYADVLADAVRALTEAARAGTDWAEFVTLALAGAAANVGGIETALAERPGSWEADGVRQLLAGTVGEDGQFLLEHRTDPVVVDVYVDELMVDAGVWGRYDAAQVELDRRGLDAAGDELEALDALQADLDQLRTSDWAAYGDAFTAQVMEAAASLGLRVPVQVHVDLDQYRSDRPAPTDALVERLIETAAGRTPFPDEREPLVRLAGPESA
jgi:hypothetical protein